MIRAVLRGHQGVREVRTAQDRAARAARIRAMTGGRKGGHLQPAPPMPAYHPMGAP